MSDTLVVTLPGDVAAELERLARDEGVSAEDLLARIAEQRVSAVRSARAFFDGRAGGADPEALRKLLQRSSGEPPRPGDEAD